MSAVKNQLVTCARRIPALLAVLWASICPAETVIRMFPSGDSFDYTPTKSMVRSPTNRYPHNHIQILADRWQKLHPGARIEFIKNPSTEGIAVETYRAWSVSNFIAGTIPHITYQNMGVYRDHDFRKGWIVAMDKYLAKPNPYVKGNKRWLDLFYTPWINALRSADGNVYWVSVDTTSVGILVNLDLMHACGIEEIPRTFGAFIAACEKVRAAGKIAYVPPYEWYSDCVIPAVIWADRIPEMDVIRKDDIIEVREMALAIEKGLFNCRDERMRAYLELTDRLYDQLPPGHIILEELYLFRNGRIAFMEAISSMVRLVQDDTERDFEFAYVPFPDITIEDSPFGGHPLAGAGNAGYSSIWVVTNSAVRDGVVDLCVDWLRYLTEPQNNDFLVNELGFTLPGIKGVEPIPIFRDIMEQSVADLETPGYLDWHAFNPFLFTPEFQRNWSRTKECLALDLIDIPETMNRLEFWLQRSHKRFVRQNASLMKEAQQP